MRVAHVIAHLDPDTGGPPFVAASLAVAQQRLGAQVRLLAYEAPAARGNVVTQVPGSDQIALDLAPWRGRIARITGADVRLLCRKLSDEIDFAHLHGVWDPIVREAAAACRRAGVPYAVCAHGALDPWCMRQSALKKQAAMWLAYRRMLNNASFLHLLNDDERRLHEPLHLRAEVEVIPNGIFAEQFAGPVEPGLLDTLMPRLEGRPYVLFLSRLHYVKGLDYLADAFALIARTDARTQLVVAGPDAGERAAFERRVHSLGIADRVHLPGALYGESKHAALSNAAVFCLPSHHEAFSMAITEAMACGTPCVVSEACHFPQVQSSGAGFVVPQAADALASALARVLNDDALRRKMGDAARRLAYSEYVWPAIAQRTIDAYERARERMKLPQARRASS